MRPHRCCLLALLITITATLDGHAQQPQTPPVEKPPVIAPAVVQPSDDIPVVDTLKTPLAINVAIRGATQGDLVVTAPVGQLLELTLTGDGAAESGPVFWSYSENIPDRSERDEGHWVGMSFPPESSGKAYLIQAAVNGPEKGPPLVALRWIVVSGHAPQPPPEVKPDAPDKPTTPDKPKPSTVTAVTYVYEKDDTVPPNAVRVALNRLNREQKIVATEFEQNSFDGDDEIPEQYKAALTAAKASGLPSLVVLADSTVVRVVKSPKTESEVMEAAR